MIGKTTNNWGEQRRTCICTAYSYTRSLRVGSDQTLFWSPTILIQIDLVFTQIVIVSRSLSIIDIGVTLIVIVTRSLSIIELLLCFWLRTAVRMSDDLPFCYRYVNYIQFPFQNYTHQKWSVLFIVHTRKVNTKIGSFSIIVKFNVMHFLRDFKLFKTAWAKFRDFPNR